MRKLLIIVFMLMLQNVCYANTTDTNPNNATIMKNAENEEVIILLLQPQIKVAINAFYSEYLKEPPSTASYYMNIIDIKPSKYNLEALHARYDVTIDVMPYIGAHIPIGKDRLVFSIDAEGCIEVFNFKHLLSYDVTSQYPNLKDMMLKPLP